MSPTRRDILRSIAGVAVALPVAALPQVAPQAAAVVPEHWNTVETVSIDDRTDPLPERSWDAQAFVFTQDEGSGRYTQRQLILVGYADGSVRLCFAAADCFDSLSFERGHTAIHLAPDLGAEVWRGIFATSADEPMPTAPMAPGEPTWDDERTLRYNRQQQRLLRMYRYVANETAIEGNPGVHRWFNPQKNGG